MPKAADQEYHQRVASDFPTRTTAAAQRNVNVIAKPSGERDVPTAPKLSDVSREIRKIEVTHQADAEQACRTDGDVRITGKVTIDLESEEYGAQQQIEAIEVLIVGEYLIDRDGTIVRHHHLFEQAPQDLTHTVYRLSVVEGTRPQELGQQIGGTLNRSRHQLGKETDEGKESHRVMCVGLI